MKNQSLLTRIGFALTGIRQAWQTESSFRIQALIALVAIGYFFWLQPSLIWWAVLVILLALVLAAELFNSALEALLDHLHPEIHPQIGLVKDMAAGAVLLLSAASLIFAVIATIAHI